MHIVLESIGHLLDHGDLPWIQAALASCHPWCKYASSRSVLMCCLHHIGILTQLEGMGVVESVGAGVTRCRSICCSTLINPRTHVLMLAVKPGQRVVPILLENAQKIGNGSWQEYLAVKEADVVVCFS